MQMSRGVPRAGMVLILVIAMAAITVAMTESLVGSATSPKAADSEAFEDTHWSFQKPVRPQTPAVANEQWPRGPIDRFILARLESEGIKPSAQADRRTLLRRLWLDLLGLAPPLDELEHLENETTPGWYEQLVDRLLDSPHFGERWGRHWLDLARFADGSGYDTDFPREHIWRYRQWVIEAHNRDLPYDVFSRYQLAGDLMPQRTGEAIIATGLHCLTLWRPIKQPELIRYREVIDRVNTTGTIWLGLSLGCVQCHDHKYDPIDQVEYYRMFAFFNNASTEVGDVALADAGTVKAHIMKSTPRTTHLHVRGAFSDLGPDPLEPGVLKVLHKLAPDRNISDRLDLANWLVHEDNPLVARVAVNRIWQHLFGHGLVRTPEEFGTQGAEPTHPELLDWLAVEYRRLGWSRKRLIRMILHSATYRQSSKLRSDLETADPENLLLARQLRWRVEAEIIHDLPLAVAAVLDRRIGGPSVHPPVPPELADTGVNGFDPPLWPQDRFGDRYRRAIYIKLQRNFPFPTLNAFDCPNFNKMVVKRTISNSPQMALTALNGQSFFKVARDFARRVLKEIPGGGNEQRLQAMGLLCLGRSLTDGEQDSLLAFWTSQYEAYRQDPPEATKIVNWNTGKMTSESAAAWVAVARVFLNLDEFITRQ